MTTAGLSEAFLRHVEIGPLAKNRPDLGRCWIWKGVKTKKGYGTFSGTTAHRHAYLRLVGPIGKGLQLDHFACDRTDCANPAHVRPVTARENLLRGDTITAKRRAQERCVHGHPFDEKNTRIRPNGTRQCRRCAVRMAVATKRRRKHRALAAA